MHGLTTVASSPINQETCKWYELWMSCIPEYTRAGSIWCHPRRGLDSDCGLSPYPINITVNLDT